MEWFILICSVLFFSYLIDTFLVGKNQSIPHTIVEQSIEDAWKATDMTTVPPDMLLTYRRYLKSPEWRMLRKIVLKRDNHRCVRCGYIGNLQVHHINYVGIYENFNFSVDQLENICYDCHNDVHKGILPMQKE